MAHTDRRLVLLGRTGSGKSATGNTILGRNMFKENVITPVCTKKQAVVSQKNMVVVDTSGLFNPAKDEEDLITEIKRGVRMSAPGPHAFLLVIRLDMDLTEEEKSIVSWLQDNFGNDAVRFTFILFTHDDHLNGESLEDCIRQNPDLQLLVDRCDGRYHSFNNRIRQNRKQVTELMEKIEQIVQINKGQFFDMPKEDPKNVETFSQFLAEVLLLTLAFGLSIALKKMKMS